jgi:hypothetical protein
MVPLQTIEILVMAIHPVVCQKSEFHRRSDLPKARPFTNASNRNSDLKKLAFQRYFAAKN